MKKLDSIVHQPIDFLKIDVQGYELEVLKGSARSLLDVAVIYIEVSFVELYKQQPLFFDIHAFLTKFGFKLFNLYELSSSTTGRLLWCDAVYIR